MTEHQSTPTRALWALVFGVLAINAVAVWEARRLRNEALAISEQSEAVRFDAARLQAATAALMVKSAEILANAR